MRIAEEDSSLLVFFRFSQCHAHFSFCRIIIIIIIEGERKRADQTFRYQQEKKGNICGSEDEDMEKE